MSEHATRRVEPHGFRQLDPLPSDSSLAEFYESRYYDLLRQGGRAPEIRRLMTPGQEREAELEWLGATLHRDIADYVRECAIPAGVFLDVGCGSGDFLVHLRDAGFEVEGIEPSSDAVAVARERGLQVAQARLHEWAAEPANSGRYSAVSMLNVLEHVPDPDRFLTSAHRLLAPGGVLVVRVPNDFTALQAAAATVTTRDRWWVAAPDHINYFDPSSLGSLLEASGFDLRVQAADFPMELFVLLGFDYVAKPDTGPDVHAMRKRLEFALPAPVRQSMYRALAGAGMGRNLLFVSARR